MSEIKSEHIVNELLFNIKHKDLIKARIVIEHIGSISDSEQSKLLYHLNKTDHDFSIPLLAILTINKPAILVKFPEIREALYEKIAENPGVIINEINKKSPELLLYLKLMSDFQIEAAIPAVIDLLTKTNDKKIILQAIASLGEMGDPDSVNAISEYLYCGDDDLIKKSIKALSNIGTPMAMQRLADRLGVNEEWDLEILEAFAKVQDSISIQKLNECLLSHSAKLRNLAIVKLVDIGKKAIPVLTDNLRESDNDLLIHSLNVIGDIGDESAIRHIRKLIHKQPKDPNVRFVAYEVLSRLPKQKGDYVLAGGMTDSDETVRIAAARAINNSYSEILSAGIRNMVTGSDEEARTVLRAIIDSQADNIVMDMVENEFVKSFFIKYVCKSTHSDIQNHYLRLLEENKFDEIAASIKKAAGKKKEPAQKKVVAVDDSTMILKIYQKVLNALGYSPVLFDKPREAVEFLTTTDDVPYLVCTDLNMPVMTGVELIKNVRQRFSKDELPIIMVTTQNDIQDRNAALEAGASDIIYKPFSQDVIGKAIDSVITKEAG